jgi:DNA-directed RNA polymerase subunit RPC12/RpoP
MTTPRRCPACGARDSLTSRYSTGGGWRVVGYRCTECGERIDRDVGESSSKP